MNLYEEQQLLGARPRPRYGFWRRVWHRLGLSYCEGEYYCEMCGEVQR